MKLLISFVLSEAIELITSFGFCEAALILSETSQRFKSPIFIFKKKKKKNFI